MERQVEQFIQSLSDVDLLEYTRTQTHLPEALEFARVELADRHLAPDRVAELEKQLQERARVLEEEAQRKAAEPLIWEWRIAILLCGLYFGIPLLPLYPGWKKCRAEGSNQKYKDMWHYALIGFCLQPILILLRIPPWSWVAKLF